MLSQEEYLDNLLKEFVEGGQSLENGMPEENFSDGTDGASLEIPADVFGEMEGGISEDVFGEMKGGIPADVFGEIEEKVPEDVSGDLMADISMELFGDPKEDEETESFPKNAEPKESYDVRDTMNMSPEDIESILAGNAEAPEESGEGRRLSDDLESLLSGSEETDLKDIQSMLHKSDNNEPVDEDIFSLLEQLEKPNLTEDEEQNAKSEGEGRKKSLAEKIKEKKKAKEAAKKEKAEKREAEKEAKKAGKRDKPLITDLKAGKGAAGQEQTGAEEIPAGRQEQKTQEIPAERQEQKTQEIPERGQEQKEGDLPEENENSQDETTLPKDILSKDILQDSDPDGDRRGAVQNVPGMDLGDTDDLFGEMNALNSSGDADDSDVSAETGDLEELIKGKEGGRKKNLFARILEALTEEEEEEEENQGLILSDENEAILKELDKEDKKKGKKKDKKKKGKAKESEASEEEGEETEKKEAKPKKPKKVREPKPRAEEKPGKKLSKKRAFLIFMICITIGAVILILGTVLVDFVDKKKASVAFYEGNYEECYQNLMGKSLNESQQVMFGKSESILKMRLWMREYERFVEEGLEPEALDSLMQSVHDYPAMQAFSGKWNATLEVQEIYSQMLDILQKKYGISEEVAKSIANESDDLKYSKMVRTIASGGTYQPNEQPGTDNSQEPGQPPETMEDILPEEEEIGDTRFAD